MPSDAFKNDEADLLYEFFVLRVTSMHVQVMPDDHSKVVPLLPIPNRTVKRFSADDSAGSRVKVGHRQAFIARKTPSPKVWGFFVGRSKRRIVLWCIGLSPGCKVSGVFQNFFCSNIDDVTLLHAQCFF